MIDDDLIFLSISLFSPKGMWGWLMENGIVKFMENEKAGDAGYLIGLNYLGGENIRFSLLCKAGDAPITARKAGKYFKALLREDCWPDKALSLPLKGMFRQFPQNSVQYGLYPPLRIRPVEKDGYLLSTSLSEILIAALRATQIDEEAILTFAFYLQAGLVKTMQATFTDFSPPFHESTRLYAEGSPILLSETIAAKFEAAKDMLYEITSDIKSGRASLEIPWFSQWLDSCKINIEKNRAAPFQDAEKIYNGIVYLVHKQLGVSGPMKAMLSFFINRASASQTTSA